MISILIPVKTFYPYIIISDSNTSFFTFYFNTYI